MFGSTHVGHAATAWVGVGISFRRQRVRRGPEALMNDYLPDSLFISRACSGSSAL